MAVEGRVEPLARGVGGSMVQTDGEWLHRVYSGPSALMSQRRGSADSRPSRPHPGTERFDPQRTLSLRPGNVSSSPKRTRRALAAFVAKGGRQTFVAGANLTARSTEPG